MNKAIVFDLETQFLFQEVGNDPKKLKVSVVGIYDYTNNEYRTYLENELPELFRRFEHAEFLVGFNSLKFDLSVLAPYYVGNIFQFAHLDLLTEVEKTLGFRVSLDDLAKNTLGIKKTGHGLLAIEYFHNKEWDMLKEYCLNDVHITKELYEYGKKTGRLYYNSSRGKQEIPVNFSLCKSENSSVSLSLPF